MRLAPIALAALLAALALAACTGGGSPPPAPSPTAEATATPMATPTATATATSEATATPTPTATPAASPTPEARSGLDLIEPAPGAFVRRTFEDGEDIDWEHGVFVLDAETGRTEGYAVAGLESDEHYYDVHPGGWIATEDRSWRAEWELLLHRETGDSWRWPRSAPSALLLEAASEEHLLFRELDGGDSTGSFILAGSGLDEVARFSVSAQDEDPHALFSPDGLAAALAVADTVYIVPVESGHPAVLFTAQPYAGTVDSRVQRWDTAGLRVRVRYGNEGKTDRTEEHYFRWDGGARLRLHTACPGTLSPDGRYAAGTEGSPYSTLHWGYIPLDNPWPSVVITDAETCSPIFRIRSAYWGRVHWSAEWLSASDGFVVGVRDGYMVARVGPEPHLTDLPLRAPHDPRWSGPDPAPTGGGRYFGYGPRVYDAAENRWRGPSDVGWGPFWWGDSHRERWFSIGYWGEGGVRWLLLPPKMELPPFSDEIAFRVARTGSCLRLREEPGADSRILACLPDGERLLFTERDAEVEQGWSGTLSPHSSLVLEHNEPRTSTPSRVWVHVRTEDGTEGWVSDGYLEHD